MTLQDLLKRVTPEDLDKIILIRNFKTGWSNIEVKVDKLYINIYPEKYPLFSNN